MEKHDLFFSDHVKPQNNLQRCTKHNTYRFNYEILRKEKFTDGIPTW